ncbi:hypothetical protein BDV34DRAFT_189441 [Aspergillus parasiticus]|uniref:Uncharacterized protein n=1 Tax=Aspergillus parasiticus TaxID=5067 RepID=A0A5N6DVL2_ASPPA|nr:hypothetical protein BDV34DRAFT_189441 [Aspergillus parasiticus]
MVTVKRFGLLLVQCPHTLSGPQSAPSGDGRWCWTNREGCYGTTACVKFISEPHFSANRFLRTEMAMPSGPVVIYDS